MEKQPWLFQAIEQLSLHGTANPYIGEPLQEPLVNIDYRSRKKPQLFELVTEETQVTCNNFLDRKKKSGPEGSRTPDLLYAIQAL